MKTVITHNDLDGVGAALIVKHAFPQEEIEVISCNYRNIDETVNAYMRRRLSMVDDFLYITDISPDKPVMDRLKKFSKIYNVLHFDHHKTRSYIKNYSFSTFDLKKSGTELISDYLGVGKDFAKVVSAYDLWKLDSPYRERSVSMNGFLQFVGFEEFFNVFKRDLDSDLTKEIQSVIYYSNISKKNYIGKKIKEYAEKATDYVDSRGRNFTVFVVNRHVSDFGNAILEHPEGQHLDYVVMITAGGSSCSLRSRTPEKKSVDVSEIAKFFGGGGHYSAAGFGIHVAENNIQFISNLINKVEI